MNYDPNLYSPAGIQLASGVQLVAVDHPYGSAVVLVAQSPAALRGGSISKTSVGTKRACLKSWRMICGPCCAWSQDAKKPTAAIFDSRTLQKPAQKAANELEWWRQTKKRHQNPCGRRYPQTPARPACDASQRTG